MGGLSEGWREFMKDNWNADPAIINRAGTKVPIYMAWDRLRDGISRTVPVYDITIPSSGTLAVPLNVNLPPLSAAYFAFRFDITVRSVEVTHNLQALSANGAELVVFTKQGEQWTIQPTWTSENTHVFCRDRAGERIDEMVVILGNSSTSRHLNFVSGMVTPAVSATSNGCLGSMDVDTGYEECQLNFPGTGNSRRDYRHFEKQTWEITRLKSRSATEALYEYRWTYQGKGTSVNEPWSATWDMSSQQNSELKVRQEIPSGIQVADGNKPVLDFTYDLTQTNLDNGKTSTGPATWTEMERGRREAPLAALRIEGMIESLPMGGPGTHQLGDEKAICRWSWPRFP